MITQNEFNQIVENHLKAREDGSMYIDDKKLEEKVLAYLSHYASSDNAIGSLNNADQDKSGLFDGWNIYCPDKPKPKGK